MRGFQKFLLRGNVVDLAVAVVIGAAFGAVITALVKDIITPIIGMAGGQPDFSSIKVGSVGLGNFLNAVIAFLIKAAGLYFLIVLPFNRWGSRPAPAPTPQEKLLMEIRDLLRQQQQQKK